MGLFDVFTKEHRQQRRLDGARKKLTNMYYQTQDRLAAAELAAQIVREGDEDGIDILLTRFEHNTQSTTIDREEKEYIHQLLLGLGDLAVEPVKAYIHKTTHPVYWPLLFISQHQGEEQYVDFLCELLEATSEDYVRNPQKKIGLIQIAASKPSERMGACILKFVDDHDETMRFHAINTLAQFEHPGAAEAIRDHLIDDEEESGRVITLTAETFAEKGWTVTDRREEFATKLPAGFTLTADGKVAKR